MEPIELRVRDCECPGHAHNGTGDVVYMRPRASVPLGLAVEADVIAAAGNSQLLRRSWIVSYIREGVVGWNLVDERGKPRPLDVQELVDDYAVGMVIAEKADELYGDAVVTPLLTRLFEPSEPGSTDDSTSPTEESTGSPPKPSSPATTAATKRSRR